MPTMELRRGVWAGRAGGFDKARPAADAASHFLLVISVMVIWFGQNISFRASCSCLSSLVLLVMVPKVAVVGFTFGEPQFV